MTNNRFIRSYHYVKDGRWGRWGPDTTSNEKIYVSAYQVKKYRATVCLTFSNNQLFLKRIRA